MIKCLHTPPNIYPKAAQKSVLPLAMTPQYLTIHSTGNLTSTAQNERDYLTNPTNKAQTSFHVVVDEKQAIECIPLTEVAWHAGDGRGNGNMKSIGLEICESGDREKTLANAAKLAANILMIYGWGIDRLRQHYDWALDKKNCPRILRNTGRWNEFVQNVFENIMEKMEEDEMIYQDLGQIKSKFRDDVADRIFRALEVGDIKATNGELNMTESAIRTFVWVDRKLERLGVCK